MEDEQKVHVMGDTGEGVDITGIIFITEGNLYPNG